MLPLDYTWMTPMTKTRRSSHINPIIRFKIESLSDKIFTSVILFTNPNAVVSNHSKRLIFPKSHT